MSDWKKRLKAAVALLGSQEKLAKAMGCSQAKVSWLLLTADQIAAEDARAVHWATGGAIPAWELRPDIWSHGADVPAPPARGNAVESCPLTASA